MPKDRKATSSNPFAGMEIDHLFCISKRIADGEYVDGPELAARLRDHGSKPIPEPVLDYLCRYLEGTIEKPKGRKPGPEHEIRRLHMIIGGSYRLYLAFLTERRRRYGHPVGWLKSFRNPSSRLVDYPPGEIAARLVARKFFHGEASWRAVQNIAARKKVTSQRESLKPRNEGGRG